MERNFPQKHKVFLLGVVVGLTSMLMLWLIIFTSLSSNTKLAVFVLFSALGLALQMYALKELKKPDDKQSFTSDYWLKTIRNYRWFGIFCSGVISPYMFSLFVYVVLKNL